MMDFAPSENTCKKSPQFIHILFISEILKALQSKVMFKIQKPTFSPVILELLANDVRLEKEGI